MCPDIQCVFTIIKVIKVPNLNERNIFQSTFLEAYAACKRNGFTLATEESTTDTENIKNAILAAGNTEYSRIGHTFLVKC